MNEKKNLSSMQIVGLVLAGIIILNFLQGFLLAINKRNWQELYNKSITLIVFGVVAYFFWGRITSEWSDLKKHRENTRKEFEKSKGHIGVKDAAIFSLAWSREIYRDIPDDRKHLVKTSFTLIGIAGGLILLHLGRYGLLTLLLIGGLIMAGVNLLIWVVGSERQDKNRIAIELEAARKMQLSLMPMQDPEVKGFDISGCCIPAHDVGGDLFDFVWLGKQQNRLCIPVVDVSGKGMDAALTAVYTSGALVSEAQHEENVSTVVDNLNSAIYSRGNRSRFVSMLMVALDVNTRRIEYINAGQARPILIRQGHASCLKGEGARFPLGIRQAPKYLPQVVQLLKNDTLLLYTDGVTEAMNPDMDMFGEARTKETFLHLAAQNLTAADIVQQLKDKILDFSAPEQQHDDLTLVVIKTL